MTRTTTLWSLLLLSAALALGSCTKDATEQATGPEPEAKAASKLVFSSENAVRGELLVCFGEEAVAGIESSVMQVTRSGGVATRSGIADFDAVLGSIGVKALQRLFPVDERNEERTRAAGLHRWYVVEFDDAADLDKAALDMARIAEVSKVEFNQQLMHVHEGRVIPLAETGAAPQTRAAVGFNDPHLGRQWHYINTGDKSIYSKIKAGADVNCDEAWKLCTGDPRVIVAVVDDCVQWDHPDLAANMWVNEAELNGTPGVDDDGNGYVDDIYGYNFTKETGELDFSAELMHGTHVAGTIAAVNNNGVGVCGIAGGSGRGDGVKIMSCEILGKSESGSSGAGLAGQIRAIKYAADNGAVICQNSWGYTAGTISVTDWTRGSYSALSRAMEYFNKYAGLDENGNQTGPMAGGIVLFAAGNDASSEVCYPAADANAISVGATAFTGAPAYYTNYGTWVRISAPGGDQMLSNAYGGVYSTSVAADGSSGYEGSQGTSMACPHVSGACALAVSYYYGAEKRKGLTGEMLRQALLSSTQSVDRYCTGKYQQYLGNMGIGSLDTYKLLRNIAKIDGIPAQRVGVGDTVSIDLSNHFTATNVLGYTVSVPDLVKIELRGGVMKLTGLKKGRTTIIVSDGAAIRKPIEVTVE